MPNRSEPISPRAAGAAPFWLYAVVLGGAARMLLAYSVLIFQPGLAVPETPARAVPAADLREPELPSSAGEHAFGFGALPDRVLRIVPS